MRKLVISAMFCLAAAAWMATGPGPAYGSIIHDEGVDGDLSDDRLDPTDLVLAEGTNSLIATSVSGDREYYTLTVPAGLQLSAVVMFSYSGLDETAFIAVQAGTSLTEPPTGTDPENLLGWTHFGPGAGNVGDDILDDMGLAEPAIGFSPPLASGDYTFWSQQTGVNAATYQFDFVVTPEPATLMLLGLVGVAFRRRR